MYIDYIENFPSPSPLVCKLSLSSLFKTTLKLWDFAIFFYDSMLKGKIEPLQTWFLDIWGFPKMVVPPKHPKMIIFCRKTHGCWVPPFKETPIYIYIDILVYIYILSCNKNLLGTWKVSEKMKLKVSVSKSRPPKKIRVDETVTETTRFFFFSRAAGQLATYW